MIATILLPDPSILHIDVAKLLDGKFVLEISTIHHGSMCPDCHETSRRVHSCYTRIVADLPSGGYRIILELTVRRFFCDNENCPRRTFTERLPTVVDHYARKTIRLLETQRRVGFSTGGEVAARLSANLAFPASPDTFLRQIRSFHEPETSVPEFLGVDDWAFRKRISYGTILVDLQTHKPIELLPDRETETLTNWLKRHPGVNVVSRDRANYYIEAINQGAPHAIQVADRWHLLHNLVETVERVLTRRYNDPKSAFQDINHPDEIDIRGESNSQSDVLISAAPPRPTTLYEIRKQQVREKHLIQFEEIRRLHSQGASIREIGRNLHMSRKKIRKYLANDAPPEYKRHRTTTILDPYWEYMEKRWKEGCRNGVTLYHEIKGMGYPGSYGSMSRKIRYLREIMPRKTKSPTQKKYILQAKPSHVRPFSSKQTAWLFVRKMDDLNPDQSAYLTRLLEGSDDFKQLYELSQQFWSIVKEKKRTEFTAWMTVVRSCGIAELRSFALGLKKDIAAVEAALTYEWSNGPDEGHNNRLKMIKR
jgi:transposase